MPARLNLPSVRPGSSSRSSWFRSLPLILAALAMVAALPARAQQASANPARITQVVDDAVLTTLKGNVHPLASRRNDRGAVAADLPMKRMLLVLKRSAVQEAALKTLMDQQQDKRSARYHQWLTPAQLGATYGPAPADIKAITTWLQSHGFEIGAIAKGGTIIEFSGTAGQVKNAFHTEIHSYQVNGQLRHANASDPQIPAALAPVVAGFASLNNFPRKPANVPLGTFTREKSSGKVTQVAGKTGFTYPNGKSDLYLLGPYDLATIYNIQPLWNVGVDGTGQTIAIVGQTEINLDDANNFRAIFGLPPNPPNIIVNGIDPGFTGDEGEADIDTQWSGAVAKNATIDFVTSATTEATAGIDLSALYIVDNNLAPVMSESYLYCEAFLGNGGNTFYNTLWQQAAAQGITVLLSSGDSGSANCDYGVDGSSGNQGAQYGLSVSGISSTPYDLAIGGTDFDQIDNSPSLYWNATNNSTTQASAKGYIPETTWNNSCTNDVFKLVSGSTDPLFNCNDSTVADPTQYGGLQVTGGAGGPSSCSSSTSTTCLGGYAKPAWQVGTFNDSVRDTPDISLFASNGFAGTFYVVCEQDANQNPDQACSLSGAGTTFQGYGGTSVASPALAGVFSLLNQRLGARVGNANYALYNLASQQKGLDCNSTTGPSSLCIFNDVIKGTISEPCQLNSPNCYAKSGDSFGVLVSDDGSGYGSPDASGYPGDLGWNTAVGYDYATGLGSINAYNLVQQWTSADFLSSTTTLALSSTSFVHGTPTTATVNVTSGALTPAGDVSFNGPVANGSVGFVTLSSGAATTTLNNLPGGSYNVTAHYGGNNDGNHLIASSDSNPVAVTISPEPSATTLTTLLYNVSNGQTTPVTSVVYGSPIITRADVAGSSGNGIATGTVAVTANGSAIPGSPLKLNSTGDSEAQFYSLNAGSYTLSGSYSGDASFNASTGTGSLAITQATPTASLTSSASSISQGASVTLNAVFDTTTYVGNAPTGAVTFYAGTTALGSPVPVTAGQDSNGFPQATATLTTTALPAGTNTVTAVIASDVNYATATSPGVTVTVSAPTPTFSITATPVSVAAGVTTGNASTITVTPANGFTGVVNLTATLTTSPSGAVDPPTIALAAPSVTISGTTPATTTATISTTAASSSALAYPIPARWYTAAGGAALGMVLFFGIPARRRGWKSMLALIVSLVAMVGVGCGGGGGGSKSNSTVTVTPASSSVAVNQALSVGVSVSGSGTPTGTVILSSGGYTSSSQTLSGGAVTIGIPANSLTVGTATITATYSGDSKNNSSTGTGTVTVTAAGNPGTTPGSYVFTVTGTDAATGKITATGTIALTVN